MVSYSCLVGKDLLVVCCVLWMYAICYDHGQGEVILMLWRNALISRVYGAGIVIVTCLSRSKDILVQQHYCAIFVTISYLMTAILNYIMAPSGLRFRVCLFVFISFLFFLSFFE